MRCISDGDLMKLRWGELPAERLADVNAHLGTCLDCQARLAEAPPTPGSEHSTPPEDLVLEKGTAVGRYLLLEKLGAGAMGVVHGAYDTELNRRVALKFLRARALNWAPEKARARLLREAQAMARVSHPNVVAVYDVGTFQERVFLAMAQVESQTLEDWLKATPRTWRQVLGVFLDAGRGLAAAHDAGVVHGDFKPANVLVDSAGRAHVTDFGLARLASAPGEDSPPLAPGGGFALGARTSSLHGGTPAYMAPELLSGASHPSPQSDQYSFCMALHEALHGTRSPLPVSPQVPTWLRAIVLRGLSPAPAERYPSVTALVSALQKGPARPWRRGLQLTGALALVAAAVGLTHALHSRDCTRAGEELAHVWGPAQQSSIQAAFVASKRPYAQSAWERVRQDLDAYTREWVTARTLTCEASLAPRAQPSEQVDQKMRCLDNRLADLAALTRLLSQADGRTVDSAHRAAQILPSLADCATAGPAPAVPKNAEWQDALTKGRGLLATGRYAEGVTLVEPVAKAAREARNRHEGAEIFLLLSELLEGAGRWRDAEAALFETLDAAEATRQDALATRAWTLLVRVSCISLDEYDKAALWKDRATAALERLGDGHPLARVQLLTYTGTLLRMQRDYARAEEKQEQALVLAESTFGANSMAVAEVLLELGSTQFQAAQLAKARATLERAATVAQDLLGPQHPDAAQMRAAIVPVLHNASMANPYTDTRYTQEELLKLAEGICREALHIVEQALGPEHPRVYDGLNDLATNLALQSRHEEALPLFQRAMDIAVKTDGAESYGVSVLHDNIASSYYIQKQFGPAREHFLRAMTIQEKIHGPRYPGLPISLRVISITLGKEGRHAEALPYGQRAVDLLSTLPDDSASAWTGILINLGRLYLTLERPDEAIPVMERAVAGWEKAQPRTGQRATARFLLARALWESGKDRKRALRLASEAQRMASLDDPSPTVLQEIHDWLEKRSRL
ncbi:serine/threonine protein kinase [Myxococcus stipitatus DSM 14675]|uniref:Serine/threonine protein kinase n=1 Tax=Myxococcus stipitatus (strain DSM 14675 / JCM 12634 / Mx s8) TaxID=1278073 RepID=L7U1B5_MYXSD|nr:serine/threonine-protein kinase [Myxococcus stipitatus]AGC41968.1 serine/threonine protein kinase [Myxococcus stipitatus DSM 14675]